MPSSMEKKSRTSRDSDTEPIVTEVTLTFDGDKVTGIWYHPEIESVICALCGKGCKEKGLPICVNVNPWCG